VTQQLGLTLFGAVASVAALFYCEDVMMDEHQKLTGFPSIDKPWLKYYTNDQINHEIPECSLYDYLKEKNESFPNDIAIIFENINITYEQLINRIDDVALRLRSLGIKAGDVVTIIALNQPETVYCFYALNKIGATASFINVLSSTDEIKNYIQKEKARFIIVCDVFFDKAYSATKSTNVEGVIWYSLYESLNLWKRILYRTKVKCPPKKDGFIYSWKDMMNISAECPENYSLEKNRAGVSLIGHTGGTTGFPKGVMLTDLAINAQASHFNNCFEHKRQESFIDMIVPFAVYGISINLHMPLVLGLKTILIPKVDPKETDVLIMKHKPNYTTSIPLYWDAFINSDRLGDLSFLKVAGAGGQGFSDDEVDCVNKVLKDHNSEAEMLIGYGMSEVGGTASVAMKNLTRRGSVGIPLSHNIIACFNDSFEEMKYNQTGEICIYSPYAMIGYIDDEKETADIMKLHPDGRVWIHTGDLGYVDEDGFVFIEGRIKRIYLTEVNGALAKLFPDRIEKTIEGCSLVKKCACICKENSHNIFQAIAFIVVSDKTNTNEAKRKIYEICKEKLPEYAIPAKIVVVDTIPVTSVGKTDYNSLMKSDL